ncbi:hypothetical protein ACFM35_10080 [Microbacterium sp. P01]|uniref:hypothetical protein n=1 Tax=Microbacterium sp. P01 TaxID=3366261 RepID=UPI00366FE40C
MTRRRRHTVLLAASVVALSAVLAACAPTDGEATPATSAPSRTDGATSGASPGVSGSPTGSPSPAPTSTSAPVAIPVDCEAMLSDAVRAQLAGTPLNDPALGVPTGVQADGSLECAWRDPRADTTGLFTTISRMNRGPALDMLNDLADTEGFNCYTPDMGTRCEKTWQNTQYPVTDGRTLYWRDGVLIDTMYSNLAPSGYTDSIIASIWG